MNELTHLVLKACRKLYINTFDTAPYSIDGCNQDPESASQIIQDYLMADNPCMIARFGGNELTCLCNYLSVKDQNRNITNYLTGKTFSWWWEPNIINQMHVCAGFFPPTIEMIEKFCELMLQDIPEVDILGSWLPIEQIFEKEMKYCHKMNLELLNPYFSKVPWTTVLKRKKVVVVHPFAKTIEQQYKKRTLLFKDDLLPEFELRTIRAVQSIAGNKTEFKDWFEALDYMKYEIDKEDYDICLIGAGAYGFPLAAHVKRSGKKGFHMGGTLQLLFGIIGKRWEGNYNDIYNYHQFFNEHWVRAGEEEKPRGVNKVEGACYW